MPTNLYGPGDNYHPENSHVIASLIRKTIIAKKNNQSFISVWGSGSSKRDFLHVDDLANACIFLMNKSKKNDLINVGSGSDISINNLIKKIFSIVDFNGKINVFKLNTDENPNVASQYGIRSIPTLMIFKGGQKVDTVVGAMSKDELSAILLKQL